MMHDFDDNIVGEPNMVIAQENYSNVPVDTLGVVVETASFGADTLYAVDWYIDGPGQPTRRVMRAPEFRIIAED